MKVLCTLVPTHTPFHSLSSGNKELET